MKHFQHFALALAGFFNAPGVSRAAFFPLDSFSTPQTLPVIVNSDPAGTTVGGRVSGVGIAGNEREILLTKDSLATTRPSDTLALAVGGGFLGLNAGLRVSHSFSILWDGSGETTGIGFNDYGLSGFNVIDQAGGGSAANTFFNFSAAVDLQGSATAHVALYKDAANYSSYEIALAAVGGVDAVYSIPLAAFVAAGTGADFHDIRSVQMTITSVKPGTDLELGPVGFEFTSIPEAPAKLFAGTSALLAGVLLLLPKRLKSD